MVGPGLALIRVARGDRHEFAAATAATGAAGWTFGIRIAVVAIRRGIAATVVEIVAVVAGPAADRRKHRLLEQQRGHRARAARGTMAGPAVLRQRVDGVQQTVVAGFVTRHAPGAAGAARSLVAARIVIVILVAHRGAAAGTGAAHRLVVAGIAVAAGRGPARRRLLGCVGIRIRVQRPAAIRSAGRARGRGVVPLGIVV
ncbi:hypothetical protein, partial [Bifidobacterium scardovii]|uniref:hypothetical protein n=1 Tax=Bifidobacterium scardovii TaxID=158787 RepID=UPI003B503BCC